MNDWKEITSAEFEKKFLQIKTKKLKKFSRVKWHL